MKEIYNAPNAELIIFTAKEKLTNAESKIPFNDEPVTRLPSGGSQGLEEM